MELQVGAGADPAVSSPQSHPHPCVGEGLGFRSWSPHPSHPWVGGGVAPSMGGWVELLAHPSMGVGGGGIVDESGWWGEDGGA